MILNISPQRLLREWYGSIFSKERKRPQSLGKIVVRAESPTLTAIATPEEAANMEKTRTKALWAELQKNQQTEIETPK
jgi:hypothetical protein